MRNMQTKNLILIVILCLSGCGVTHSRQAANDFQNRPTPSSSPPTNNASAISDNTIRGIDFGNFTYDWYPTWGDAPDSGRKIILKDGSMDLGFRYGKEPRRFLLIDNGVRYGDLTRDGAEESVVVLNIITSGSARPYLVFVYTMSQGQPKRIWSFETGDRWDYGYRDAFIKDNQLVIERYKPIIVDYEGQKHNMSSSDTYIRDYYNWTGSHFSEGRTEELAADPNDKNPWVAHRNSSNP